MEGVLIVIVLGTILSSIFHDVGNFFYTFLHPVQRLYWTGISSPYRALWLIRFPVSNNFTFDDTVRWSKKKVKSFT